MNHTSRNLALLLFNLRKGEEEALPSNAFTGRIAKGYRYGLLAASVVGIGMGFFLLVVIRDSVSGTMFGMLGIAATLMLPTYFSYRLYVDKTVIRETYCILCFRKSKEVFWKDVAYKRIKRGNHGDACVIRLYSIGKKKLIAVDYSVVGFGKIVKMAKKIPTLKR